MGLPNFVDKLVELLHGNWSTVWLRFGCQQLNQGNYFCIKGGAE
jgi:hypothetical protein